MKLPRVLLAAVLFFATCLAPVFAAGAADAGGEVAVPPLKARVTDLTATLSAGDVAALESKLAAFEQSKGSQIVVLLVPTTQPETIEQFGIKVAEKWKIGRKGVDDGVILIIAKEDRKLRIEVGRGLEGPLPDATAKRIIAEYIVPPFKQGNFNGGINEGVDRIIKIIDGEALPAPKPSSRGASASIGSGEVLGWGALLVVFLGGMLRAWLGTFFGSLAAAALAGGAAMFFGVGAVIAAVIGGIVFLFCLIGLSFFGNSGGGWTSGGSSGGGGWSGGGGGDFGGGGASGSWD